MSKLEACGIISSLLPWLKSYLEGRRLGVKFSGMLSFNIAATLAFRRSCLLFADNIKLFKTIITNDNCLVLQRILSEIEEWCEKNCMDLNVITLRSSNYSYTLAPNPRVSFCCMVLTLNSVQTRFLCMIGARLGFAFKEVPVQESAVKLGLQPLSTIRKVQDSLRCTAVTLSRDLFWRHFNYETNSTLDQVQRQGIDFSSSVDFFDSSYVGFRRELKCAL
ncbi:hypothetical protein J6590_070505 [Homalodisca vitripennis]|nr:hypothetical protein J6590_070505 [Homalodisca vitripennis]